MKSTPNLPPERPEILDIQLRHLDEHKMVLYQEVGGPSPEITNHLSRLDFEITHGVGKIATKGMIVPLTPGSKVAILPGETYAYAGTMDMFITSQPPADPEFITYGGQKLGREQKHFLRRMSREASMERIIRNYVQVLDTVSPYMRGLERWQPGE